MQIKYIDALYSRFIQAKGYNGMDLNSSYMNDEFEEWLEQCADQLSKYRRYLDYRKIDYNRSDVAEIGHGSLDTVIEKNSKSLIVTPYSDSFENKEDYNIASGYFHGFGYNFSVCKRDSELCLVTKEIVMNLDNYNTFITQNPSDLRLLKKLIRASYFGRDIRICFYGNDSDNDKEKKIKIMNDLKDKIFDYEYEEINVVDKFMYLIYTNKNKEESKQLKKTF